MSAFLAHVEHVSFYAHSTIFQHEFFELEPFCCSCAHLETLRGKATALLGYSTLSFETRLTFASANELGKK